MASTAPAKSQPLHNFTLPHHLKWNKDGQSGGSGGGLHHRRRSIKSPSRRPNASSPSPVRHSPLRDSVSAAPPPRHQSPPRENPHHTGKHPSPPAPFSGREWAKRSTISVDPTPHHLRRHDLGTESVDYRRIHPKTDGSRNTVAPPTNPERIPQTKSSKGKEIEASASKKSKILIKIPCKSNPKTEVENPIPVPAPAPIPIPITIPIPPPKIDNKAEADESIDEETKVWNLRPRKPIRRPVSANGGGIPVRSNGSEKNKAESKSGENSQKKGGGGGGEKKIKKKVSVFLSLSKEEIEEDIFSLTGSKPARRPKKRPKNVQRQVDTLFPGSWLVSISADSYKVSENSLKG